MIEHTLPSSLSSISALREMAVVCSAGPSSADARLLNLARFFGAAARPTSCDLASSDPPGDNLSFAMSADTLARLAESVSDETLLSFFTARAAAVLVYGFCPLQSHLAVLGRIAPGLVHAIGPLPQGATCRFPQSGRAFTHQLAGTEYVRDQQPSAFGFQTAPSDGRATVLMAVNDLPTFLHLSIRGCDFFLSTCADIADPEQPLLSDAEFFKFYDAFLPTLIFVRWAFQDRCWHSPIHTARLLIDDPLLRETYGSLKYRELFRSMDSLRYTATVAFIPWNYKRTSPAAARWFSALSDKLSTCIHGCDHTDLEFGSHDPDLLRGKAQLARNRMQQHQQRTGIPCEPVMVFPKGQFTPEALLALRQSGYLAAIDTHGFPLDSGPKCLQLGDLLQPAIGRFHGFPVFRRHYPRTVFDYALDLYLGRPAFLVEHHGFFAEGMQRLEKVVSTLQALEPGLQWLGLSEALARVCQQRLVSERQVEVRFFASTFQFENRTDRRMLYRLTRPDPVPEMVRSVSVNQREVTHTQRADSIELEVELDAGQVAQVQVNDAIQSAARLPRNGPLYYSRVLVRRGLSEFRDGYLAGSPGLLRAGKSLARLFHL